MEKNKSEGASRGSAKNKPQRGRGGASSGKLRGLPTDSPQIRTSKTVSWILRHGADKEGVTLRPDGYARVQDLLSRQKLKDVTFDDLQELVKNDAKTRFQLLQEPDPSTGSSEPVWWIRANQGHSLKTVKVELQPVASVSDIPTGVAVHGTNAKAWDLIKTQGLSKMTRNHIHLAQGVPGSGVISGMRNSATILIYVDVQKALDAGIKFYLSANGVVLTEGNASGFLKPEFFQRVTNKNGEELTDWRKEGAQSDPPPKDAKLKQAGETTLAADSTTSLEKETEKLQL